MLAFIAFVFYMFELVPGYQLCEVWIDLKKKYAGAGCSVGRNRICPDVKRREDVHR